MTCKPDLGGLLLLLLVLLLLLLLLLLWFLPPGSASTTTAAAQSALLTWRYSSLQGPRGQSPCFLSPTWQCPMAACTLCL